MLHPSYSDLMKVVNSEVEQGDTPVVNSRYSIVMATTLPKTVLPACSRWIWSSASSVWRSERSFC